MFKKEMLILAALGVVVSLGACGESVEEKCKKAVSAAVPAQQPNGEGNPLVEALNKQLKETYDNGMTVCIAHGGP